jgi:hypothetical protein
MDAQIATPLMKEIDSYFKGGTTMKLFSRRKKYTIVTYSESTFEVQRFVDKVRDEYTMMHVQSNGNGVHFISFESKKGQDYIHNLAKEAFPIERYRLELSSDFICVYKKTRA